MDSEIEIRKMNNKDFKKAINYAVKGMHFNMYLKNNFLLKLYGKYFWYMELLRSSQIISAYIGDEFVGVLLADIKGEPKIYKSFWKSIFIKFIDWFQNTFVRDGVGPYDTANKEMLKNYKEKDKIDGEICFLAADPDCKTRGIGSKLLEELEKREKGKTIFLYTDDKCTYQFYEHREFEKVGEKDIELEIENRKIPLKCLMYCKKII